MSGKASWRKSGVHLVRTMGQVVLICVIWLAADGISRHFALPVPGGVLGLLTVVALLLAGWLPLGMVTQGAQWLLAEMLLFFMPAVVAIVNHIGLFCRQGICLVGVIMVGTVLVMIVTALAVDWAWRVECRLLHYLELRRIARGLRAASTQ